MTHLQFQFQNCHTPTVAIADRVAEFRLGGEAVRLDAKLSKDDYKWWPKCLKGIEDAIRAEAVAIATPDAELIAKIPEEAYKDALARAYGQREKDAARAQVQEAYLRSVRDTKAWVMYIGFLHRDAERLLHEGILMGPKVIEARTRLLAFAGAVAVETGCAKFVPDAHEDSFSFEDYEEAEGA